MNINYAILFEAKVLHHFFLDNGQEHFEAMSDKAKAAMMQHYDIRDIFVIEPDMESRRSLERHRCIFRLNQDGFIVAMKAEPCNTQAQRSKPVPALDEELVLTFLVHLKDPCFMNYTALPLNGNGSRMYLFQNLVTPFYRQYPSLSSVPPLYSGDKEYLPGDMVVDDRSAPESLFTAVQKTSGDPLKVEDWKVERRDEGLPMCYANINERVLVSGGVLNYRMKSRGVEPVVSVTTISGQVVSAGIIILPGEFRVVQADLRALPDGLYSMNIETGGHVVLDNFFFYLLKRISPPFGMIRLTARSDEPAYNMVDQEGCLLNPVYEIRFRNRWTHWRYIGENFDDSSVTEEALPLTRFGFIDKVSVPGNSGSAMQDLPNPCISMLKASALINASEKRFYSEIHIH